MTDNQSAPLQNHSPSELPLLEVQRRRTALETLTFPGGLSGRLQREQGWSQERTEEVLAEYRRFLILAATQNVSMTPSSIVDHAWHAHLEYTRAYWETLCGEILGEPLHHTPGEPGEEGRFQQAYLETLDRYREVFGQVPPPTCWPDPRRTHVATFPARGRKVTSRMLSVIVPGLFLSIWLLHEFRLGVFVVGAALLVLAGAHWRAGGTNARRPSWRASSAAGDSTLFFASGGDAGSCDTSSHASCGSSCGGSCGSGCGGGCGS